MKQNGLHQRSEHALLFLKLWYQNLIPDPLRYRVFRETGPRLDILAGCLREARFNCTCIAMVELLLLLKLKYHLRSELIKAQGDWRSDCYSKGSITRGLLDFCAGFATIIKVHSLTNSHKFNQPRSQSNSSYRFVEKPWKNSAKNEVEIQSVSEKWFLVIFLQVTMSNLKTSPRRYKF